MTCGEDRLVCGEVQGLGMHAGRLTVDEEIHC